MNKERDADRPIYGPIWAVAILLVFAALLGLVGYASACPTGRVPVFLLTIVVVGIAAGIVGYLLGYNSAYVRHEREGDA